MRPNGSTNPYVEAVATKPVIIQQDAGETKFPITIAKPSFQISTFSSDSNQKWRLSSYKHPPHFLMYVRVWLKSSHNTFF